MKVKNKDIISSVVLIAISIAGLFLCRDIDKPFRDYDLGAAFVPQLTLWLILGVSVLKIVVAVIENSQKNAESRFGGNVPRGLLTILLVGAYCFLYKPVGFILHTAVYLFLQITVVTPKEKNKLWKNALIAVLTTAIAYLIFSIGFSIRFPKGILSFL